MIKYTKLTQLELKTDLFDTFNRYQEVTKCWRKESERWILKDISFTEQWDSADKHKLTQCLSHTIRTGGVVYGAFEDKILVGFASLESELFGSNKEYLQLSSIHTSYESRGKGMGKGLFQLICESAIEMGAKKLYISAHSALESQAFYHALGCVEAKEYNKQLVDEEPCDCQLEYSLH